MMIVLNGSWSTSSVQLGHRDHLVVELEIKDFRDFRAIREVKELQDRLVLKASKVSKDFKVSKDSKDFKASKDSKEFKDHRLVSSST
jgi:hypothetical protein